MYPYNLPIETTLIDTFNKELSKITEALWKYDKKFVDLSEIDNYFKLKLSAHTSNSFTKFNKIQFLKLFRVNSGNFKMAKKMYLAKAFKKYNETLYQTIKEIPLKYMQNKQKEKMRKKEEARKTPPVEETMPFN